MSTEVFAEAPTHHLRVALIVDLTLALLIAILRGYHIDFASIRRAGSYPKQPAS